MHLKSVMSKMVLNMHFKTLRIIGSTHRKALKPSTYLIFIDQYVICDLLIIVFCWLMKSESPK